MMVEFYDLKGKEGTITQGKWDCVPRAGEHVNFYKYRWMVQGIEYGRMKLHPGSDHEDPDTPIAYVALVDKEEM